MSETYYSYIIVIEIIILVALQFFINKRKLQHSNELEESGNENMENFNQEQNNLSFNYLCIYITARTVIWIKAPFIILNFISLGYNFKEISLLYLLDLVSAALLGPFIGNISDTFGRKKSCAAYFIIASVDLLLKSIGYNSLILISQVLNGITTVMIHNTFESWINLESISLFTEQEKKIAFLRNVFKDSTYYDSISSVLSTIISTGVYSLFGIRSPFYLSIVSSLIGFFAINYLFKDNTNLILNRDRSYSENMVNIKNQIFKKSFLIIGLIEVFSYTVLIVFIYIWTPLLIEVYPEVNIGIAFLCFTFSIAIFSKVFEVYVICNKSCIYQGFAIISLIQCGVMISSYYTNTPALRLIFLTITNGSFGYILPTISYLKSNYLNEEYRTLLMGLYKLPTYLMSIGVILISYFIVIDKVLLVLSLITIIPLMSTLFIMGNPLEVDKHADQLK